MSATERLQTYVQIFAACLLTLLGARRVFGQTDEIRCEVHTEQNLWNRNTETVITGTIVNLTDGPLQLEVHPSLYLSSRTSSELRARFWAPVDLLHDSPIATKRQKVGKVGETIEPIPVRLQFTGKDDAINFKVDARHLRWAREISSVWPDSSFFGTVTPNEYDIQLVLETPNGRTECPALKIRVEVTPTDGFARPSPQLYELYSWPGASGIWNFCLLPSPSGVNIRAETIFNKKFRIAGIDQLERGLSLLPTGARVIWLPRLTAGQTPTKESSKLALPSLETVEKVKSYAHQLGIEVEIPSSTPD